MSAPDYDALDDAALDRAIAERMGVRVGGEADEGAPYLDPETLMISWGMNPFDWQPWRPTTDPRDWMRVVEWVIREKRCKVEIRTPAMNAVAHVSVELPNGFEWATAEGDVLGRVVVIAALRATDGEGGR